MSISPRLLFLLLAVAAEWAVAESKTSSVPVPGHCDTAAPLAQCRLAAPVVPAGNAPLRTLRLQDAVEDGDLSAQDAARFLATHKSADHKQASRPHADSSQPSGRPHGNKGHSRFWREERRRLSSDHRNDLN